MKVSLAWLNEYLQPHVTADEAETLLTAQGLPIETRTEVAGDAVLDVEVTSNRPDCLSHLGVAREIAAGSGRGFKAPSFDLPAGAGAAVETLTSVQNTRTDLCPVYTARVIRGVKVGPSPAWMVRRLEALGLRSVNNVVDVTNYVLLEMAQPLHAFDLAKLAERRIVVRTAAEGEPFTAIDGSKHKLAASMLVIADAKRPVAVAGVMGGLESEVGTAAADILLESARFDPLSIRRTSRALKLASDSSYRFERGIDPAGVELASRRAAALIAQLAGGTIAAGVVRAGAATPQPARVSVRVQRCNSLLGYTLTPQRMVEMLGRLGLAPTLSGDGKSIDCTIPTYRLDLQREVDLIEEVARLHGYDHIGVNERIQIIARPTQAHVKARHVLSETLVAHSYHETVTFSFVAPRLGEPFVPTGEQAVQVDDERRKAEPMLRPSLLPSLMLCRKSNQDAGNTGVRLFESAAVWARRSGKIVERRSLAMLADAGEDTSHGLRGLRGTIEELVVALAGDAELEFTPVSHPAFAAVAGIRLAGKPLGAMGLIAPGVQRLFELHTPALAAELDLDALLAGYPPAHQVKPLARFPGIERDLSVVVAETVTWDQIRREVLAVAPALLERLSFLVTYRGKPIPAGKKSVSLRMLFCDPSATLRHEQVDPQVAAVVEGLKKAVGAELRA